MESLVKRPVPDPGRGEHGGTSPWEACEDRRGIWCGRRGGVSRCRDPCLPTERWDPVGAAPLGTHLCSPSSPIGRKLGLPDCLDWEKGAEALSSQRALPEAGDPRTGLTRCDGHLLFKKWKRRLLAGSSAGPAEQPSPGLHRLPASLKSEALGRSPGRVALPRPHIARPPFLTLVRYWPQSNALI